MEIVGLGSSILKKLDFRRRKMIYRIWNDNDSFFSFCRIVPRVCPLVLFLSPKMLYRWSPYQTHHDKRGIFNTGCESASLVFTKKSCIMTRKDQKIASYHSLKLVLKITTNYHFYTKSKRKHHEG